MTHLGDRASALVDGQLDPESTERATAHLAQCRDCRDLVEAQRLIKARLSLLQGPEPAPDLVGRLMAMGGPQGPLPPRAAHVPGSPRPQHLRVPARARPGPAALAAGPGRSEPPGRRAGPRARRPGPSRPGRGAGDPSRGGRPASRRGRVGALVGALSVLGAVGLGGLALSAGPGPAPVVPPLDSFVVEHAATTGGLPLNQVPALWQPTGTDPRLDPSPGPGGGAGR